MKKISSNIIIFLLITAFLWGGVNFNFEKNKNSHIIEITSAQAQTTTSTTASSTTSSKPSKWSVGTIIMKGTDFVRGVASLAWFIPLSAVLLGISSICNLIVGIQALVFDGLLAISMTSFGSIIDSSGIVTAWTMIRNLINVSFIFVILYIAISIILGSFGPKKKSTVAGVVVSALLINYSMFITRVIIDFGNIIATAIYNTPSGAFSTGRVMQALQLQTILTPDNLLATGQLNTIVLMLLQIVMVCTFIAVLFRGTLFMLGRLVALLVLIALSPIGFVGFGIPWLKDKADEWWTALIGQVFLLPVFLFFLMMTNTMLKAAGNIIGIFNLDVFNMSTHIQSGSSLADGSSYTAFQPGQWVYFGLIIGMLHLSTKMTKSMAGKTMSDLVDKAAKGMKFAAAAAIAVGASVVTGGAAAAPIAARLTAAAANGGRMANMAKGGLSLMSKGASAAKVFKQPGLVGDMSRGLLKNTLSAVKSNTGLDIEAANKELKDYQKNYTKYVGEEATRIGPADAISERKNRQETVDGIKKIADERMSNDPLIKELKDAAEQTKTLTEEIAKKDKEIEGSIDTKTKTALYTEQQKMVADKTQQEEIVKDRTEKVKNKKNDLIKEIAEESGYDMAEHKKRMGEKNDKGEIIVAGEIEVEIKQKRDAQNQYLKRESGKGFGGAGKKAVDVVRVAVMSGKYKPNDLSDDIMDAVNKAAKKKADETKKEEPEGEKKEEKEEKK